MGRKGDSFLCVLAICLFRLRSHFCPSPPRTPKRAFLRSFCLVDFASVLSTEDLVGHCKAGGREKELPSGFRFLPASFQQQCRARMSSTFWQCPLLQCQASFWILGPEFSRSSTISGPAKWCPPRPQHQPYSVSSAFSSPTYGILPQLSTTARHLMSQHKPCCDFPLVPASAIPSH